MASTATKQIKIAPKGPPRQVPDIDTEQTAAPAKKKRKRSLPKILLLLTLLLGGAGGGTWYFLPGEDPAADAEPATAKASTTKPVPAKPASSKPPVFVALEPFTVNLQQDDALPQYLQVGLSLKLTDPSLVDEIKLHMPEIRNRVLLLLSGKKASEISTSEGKKTLSAELAREIVQPLASSLQAQALDSVLFTSFVIQ